MNDLEQQLRTTFGEIAAHDTPPADLAERLIANARSGSRTVVPLRARARLLRPMLAAAVVVLLAAGVLIGTRFVSDGPSVTPPVAPVITEDPPAPPSWYRDSNPLTGPAPWFTATAPRATGLPSSFVPQGFQFLDSATGFLLGTGTCTSVEGDCGGLFRTSDAGATWTALGTAAGGPTAQSLCPPGSPEIETCKSGVDFSDADHGVVWTDGRVSSTADGGASWKSIEGLSGQHVVQARQIGDDVLAMTWKENDDGPSLRIVVSADGAPFAVADTAADLTGVRGLTATGGRWYVDSPQGSTPRILSTTDGRQWRTEPTPPCTPVTLTGKPDGSVVVMCSEPTFMAPSAAVLAAGATTWTTVGGARVTFAGTSYSAQVAAVVDAEHYALVVETSRGDSDRTYLWAVTRDGGANWQTTASSADAPTPGSTADPVDDVDGMLVGSLLVRGYLVISTDLGLTWTARAVR